MATFPDQTHNLIPERINTAEDKILPIKFGMGVPHLDEKFLSKLDTLLPGTVSK